MGKIITLIDYSTNLLAEASNQGRPEFALRSLEKKCLRYYRDFYKNFTVVVEDSLE